MSQHQVQQIKLEKECHVDSIETCKAGFILSVVSGFAYKCYIVVLFIDIWFMDKLVMDLTILKLGEWIIRLMVDGFTFLILSNT